MIRSMTGYGRAENVTAERKITIEIKSVNHRYLDLNIRMPKKFSLFEGEIRNLLKTYAQRGKIDLFITCEDYASVSGTLKYNRELAAEYLNYLREMEKDFGLENDIKVSQLSRYPDVFVMEEQSIDEEKLWNSLAEPIREACRKFVETREREGHALRDDLLKKLDGLNEMVGLIEKRSPEVVSAYREKLETKVRELLADTTIEESRIAAEVVIYSDKICNDEETVRLKSHIGSMKKALEEGNGVGRKLDFVAQEMNREANTILSKSNDLEVSNIAIEVKTEIEKIREQIQNIE